MPMLPVLQYPDARLRTKAKPVERFDAELKHIVRDMFDTLYGSENCAAYAATQLNIHKRITVIDFSEQKNQPLCLINPEILEKRGECDEAEGCMSVPDYYASVRRAEWIKVRAMDVEGKPFEFEADGFMAKCIQHEMDHLNGVLFIDYLSPLKRRMLDKKLAKEKIKIEI